MSLRVLAVCTGNVARSPLVAQLLRVRLPKDVVRVESAGVNALVGAPMATPARQIAERHDIVDARAHHARQLTAVQLREHDLVLALSREHRSEIARLHPIASRYTFTLRECADIIRHIPKEELREVLSRYDDPVAAALWLLSARRGTQSPMKRKEDYDVVDPYGRSSEIYERSTSQIVPAVDAVAEYFALALAMNDERE